MQNEELDEFTDEEFYDLCIKDIAEQEHKNKKWITYRLHEKEVIARVARACRYAKHEVEDVLKGYYKVLNEQLDQGREFSIGGMFTVAMYKPAVRRIWDDRQQKYRLGAARPKLAMRPTDEYQLYLWRGYHGPVIYFPPEKTRGRKKDKYTFTAQYSEAYQKWFEEDTRRKAKEVEKVVEAV